VGYVEPHRLHVGRILALQRDAYRLLRGQGESGGGGCRLSVAERVSYEWRGARGKIATS
jgi:hypothetical protein